jgi:hypothetical protein
MEEIGVALVESLNLDMVMENIGRVPNEITNQVHLPRL